MHPTVRVARPHRADGRQTTAGKDPLHPAAHSQANPWTNDPLKAQPPNSLRPAFEFHI